MDQPTPRVYDAIGDYRIRETRYDGWSEFNVVNVAVEPPVMYLDHATYDEARACVVARLEGTHDVTRTATEWKCVCGRRGVIISDDTRSFACAPQTGADRKVA